jgi:RNase adaptor protein for sRNA GlmZ degradation
MLRRLFGRTKTRSFRTRSPRRDQESDTKTLAAVQAAIDKAIAKLEAERAGLSRRYSRARDMASMTVGTEHDEYLSREPIVLADLRQFEDQMKHAALRLKTLNEEIASLQAVRETFVARVMRFTSASDAL